MYPIHFYKDRNGHEPVREYIETLSINSTKILESNYIKFKTT